MVKVDYPTEPDNTYDQQEQLTAENAKEGTQRKDVPATKRIQHVDKTSSSAEQN